MAVLAGLGGVALCAYGAWYTSSIAEMLGIIATGTQVGIHDFEPGHWQMRWRVACTIVGAAAAAVCIGGIAVVCRRAWGLLSIVIGAGSLASWPWLMRAVGAARYTFEEPATLDTVVFGGTGLAFLVAYAWLARHARRNP